MKNRKTLVEENVNLVYSVVSKTYPTYLHDEDIIQSGMLGLCRAADSWDERKSKFSTYAWKCIVNEIRQEFVRRKPHSKNVSLSTKVGEDGTLEDLIMGEDGVDYQDTTTFCEQLSSTEMFVFNQDRLGFSTEEIASKVGLSLDKVQKILRIVKIKWRNFNGYADCI